MQKLLLFSLGLFLVLQSGNALRCYRCRSHRKDDCLRGGPLTRTDQCPQVSYNSVQFCIYKEIYDTQLQAPTYTTDCGQINQTPHASDLQSLIQQQQCQSSGKEQVRDCKICMTDLCNSGINTPQYNPNPNTYNPNTYNPNSNNMYRPNSYNPSTQNSDMYRPGGTYNPNDPYNRNSDVYHSGSYNADTHRSGDYNADQHRPANYDSSMYRNTYQNPNYRQ